MGNIIENLEALYSAKVASNDISDIAEIEEMIINAWAERIKRDYYCTSIIPQFIRENQKIEDAIVESMIRELIKDWYFWNVIPHKYTKNKDIVLAFKIVCQREIKKYLDSPEYDIFSEDERSKG
jgi:hypothetical protein